MGEKMYTFREFYIPDRMMGGLIRYIENGIAPGDFLTAVICNDLKEAVGRADDENIRNLPAYLGYLYNEAPMGCWGSPGQMKRWMKEKREEAEEVDPTPWCHACGSMTSAGCDCGPIAENH
jgi:hypothetical protein